MKQAVQRAQASFLGSPSLMAMRSTTRSLCLATPLQGPPLFSSSKDRANVPLEGCGCFAGSLCPPPQRVSRGTSHVGGEGNGRGGLTGTPQRHWAALHRTEFHGTLRAAAWRGHTNSHRCSSCRPPLSPRSPP